MNLEKLKELAEQLPEGPYRDKATALVTKMGEVVEGIGDKPITWHPSTARVVQATSDRSKLPRGATVGDIVLGEEVVPRPMKIIPLRIWDARQYWSPDPNEAKILCQSPDAAVGRLSPTGQCRNCPHSEFKDNKIDCNKIKVVISVAADLSDVFLVNFAKTGYKIGMDWQSTMKKAGVSPYRRVYGLTTEPSKQHKNVEMLSIEVLRGEERDTPAELIPFVTELFAQVGEDRKENLERFHEYIRNQSGENKLALESSDGADSTLAVEYAESTVQEAAPASEDSPDAGTEVAAPPPSTRRKYTVE